MGVPSVYFSRAPGPGRERRMKSSLPSTCQANHNCSGLHLPHQLRGNGAVFTNSPALPQAVCPKTASARGSPFYQVTESLDRLRVALMETIWPGLQAPSFFQKGKKTPSPSLIASQTPQNMAAVFLQVPSGIHARPLLWHRNQILSALCASGLILPTASIISRLLSGAFRVACQVPEPQGVTQCCGEASH